MTASARRFDLAALRAIPPRKTAWPADGVVRTVARLYPGDVVASESPLLVSTILGSCVAVGLWDVVRGIGGMNHFMLPTRISDDHDDARYAEVACHRLIKKVVALGAERRDLRAKVIGGATVVDAFRGRRLVIGAENLDAAIDILTRASIDIVDVVSGGRSAVRLAFATDTGALRTARLAEAWNGH
jgi:chemotaxis protein CheD